MFNTDFIINLFLVFIFSITLSFLFIHIFSKLFYKIWILDNPEKYWKKRKPIPYSMWIIFFLSFFILSSIFINYNHKLWLIWIFWLVITIISFLDDRINLSPKFRLLIQILIWATIWLTSIKIGYVSNIFWWIINLETYNFQIFDYTIYIIPFFFTIIWYVFIFNALNWSDWIQWNTSWISFISFLIIFLLWYILFQKETNIYLLNNAEFITKTSLILIWIILPFWYFDFKEKILMWDSWTMFLWFMLATLAIISGWKVATVLVVFWIYTVDAFYVIVKRLLNKKNPLSGDFTHLHHRLLKIWLNKNQVLFIIYSLSLLFWLTWLFLEKEGKIIVFCIIIVVVIFINKIIENIYTIKKWKKKNEK